MEKDKKNSCEQKDEEVFLPGFRFHPTDEELVGFYLRRKIEKKPLSIEVIKQIDIYKYNPWDLPKSSNGGGEKEWYFFCLRGRKYKNSIRPNRVTDSGFWKATGIDRPIYSSSSNNGECIGLKKSLVYYRGNAGKGTKTDWMMHEYRLPSNPDEHDNKLPPSMQEAEVWTICRIFKRNITQKKHHLEVKESSSKKDNQAQEQSSSLTNNSFESDARDSLSVQDKSLHQSHPPNYAILMQDKFLQSDHFQGSSSAWNCQNYNAMNALLKDGNNWDELGRIMGYFGDSSAIFDDKNG